MELKKMYTVTMTTDYFDGCLNGTTSVASTLKRAIDKVESTIDSWTEEGWITEPFTKICTDEKKGEYIFTGTIKPYAEIKIKFFVTCHTIIFFE